MSVIYFSNVRCSFPNLATPFVSAKFPGSPPMFTVDIIDIDPNDVKVREFLTTYASLAQATWKEHSQNVMQMIQNDKRARCFGMGPEKINETTFKPLEGYGQGVWINAKNKNRPQMIRPDGQAASNDMEALELCRKIYGGCRVNVAVKPWIRTTNKGISCDLIAIQFAGEDKPFGDGQVDASGMFQAAATAPLGTPPQVNQNPWSGGGVPSNQLPSFAAPQAQMPPPPTFGAPQVPSFFGTK